MKQIIIKKWIDGNFQQVCKFTENEVKSICYHQDGLEIMFNGYIRVFDKQCIVEFEDVKDEDLEKEIVRIKEHYINVKELNCQIDLRDVEAVARHFANWNKNKTVYVVTRSEEHADYVEKVFVDENKAIEYCDGFKDDENEYSRNYTEKEITL